jgi:hypothetical protein
MLCVIVGGKVENKKVYVVTSGEYSDYSIVAVCSTREIADKITAAENAKYKLDTRVEKWEMDKIVNYNEADTRFDD